MASLPLPTSGQVLVYDVSLRGFGVRLTPTKKTFICEHRLRGTGKNRRYTIGPCSALTLPAARKQAKQIIGELVSGHDRRSAEREAAKKSIPLSEVFEAFLATRRLRAKTVAVYRHAFSTACQDIKDKPWIAVNCKGVMALHAVMSKRHGKGFANLAARVLSAVLGFARQTYRSDDDFPLTPENPVSVLGRLKLWHRLEPRTAHIPRESFGVWWAAVESEKNEAARDYLKLVVLSGLRMGEALNTRWQDVDLVTRTIRIPVTKNGSVHMLPLSPYLADVLSARKAGATSEFVFPGEGRTGHLCDPKKAIARVTAISGVRFSSHALRRTLSVYADWLNVDTRRISRILNHTPTDVTDRHYIGVEVERLRTTLNRINEFMLRLAGVNESGEVIPMEFPQISEGLLSNPPTKEGVKVSSMQ